MTFRRPTVSIALAITLSLLLFAVTAGFAHFGMPLTNDIDGTINMNCYMPGMASLCAMRPLEHIAAWQVMFLSIPFFAAAIFMQLLLAVFANRAACVRSRSLDIRNTLRAVVFFHHSAEVRITNALQELFASGILHPKLFSVSPSSMQRRLC